jgi:hypothetical protein
MGVVMPTKMEEASMSVWLREMRIAFEVTRHEVDKTIELSFIDYKHQCLIARRTYEITGGVSITYTELKELVKRFEREEIYPILFDDEVKKVTRKVVPMLRLIRED